MTSSGNTIFSARKLNPSGNTKRQVSIKRDLSLLSPDNSGSVTPVEEWDDQLPSEELTRADRYVVSRLANSPLVLEDNVISRGVVQSKFAVAINNNTIYVWNYLKNNNSSTPITLSFPYEANAYGLKPFVVLLDNEKSPDDPGMCIVDSYTGAFRYYESIVNAPLLNVLNLKILDLKLKLHNEFITLVEYVKDLGIFLATSLHRVILVTLKDTFNKPQLNSVNINSSASSLNFFTSIFNNPSKTYNLEEFNKSNNRIVTIKEIPNDLDDSLSKKIVIQDSEGQFELWQFTNNSMNNKFKVNIKKALCDFLADIYDNVHFSFKILDLVALEQISDDVFLILSSFDKDGSSDLKNLVLFTVKITESDILIYSTYKLTCYSAQAGEVPKLILPKPYNTCFIIISNSVVLVEVITSLDPVKLLKLNYHTKWEDLISFRSAVEIVGYGFSNKDETNSRGLFILTSNAGLLKVENLPSLELSEEMDELELNLKLQQEPMLFIKSHIEQAIYYGTNQSLENPLLFNIPSAQNFQLKDVESAILKVLNELITNDSKYLPKIYPSVEDFLKKRNQIVQTLTNFILTHFEDLSIDLKILMLNILNKFKAALIFYTFIKADSKLLDLTKSIINDKGGDDNDHIRDYFFYHITEIGDLVSKFIASNSDQAKNLELLSRIGESYLEFEKGFRYEKLMLDVEYDVVSHTKPYLIETDQLLLNSVNTYNIIYNDNRDTLTVNQREQFVTLSQFLFYSFNDVMSYTLSQESDLYNILEEIYKTNKSKWITILGDFGFNEFVVKVADHYKDMGSIAEVLDNENDVLLLEHYATKYGYQFCSSYYEYLIQHKEFNKLFKTPVLSYLPAFFNENKKYNYISWIYQIQVEDFATLANVLNALQEEDTLVTNKQLNLSLAKLAVLQNGANSDDESAVLMELNHQLLLCQYQLEIEIDDEIPTNLIEKLKSQRLLTVSELIDLLSHTRSESNFYKAYDVVKQLSNSDEMKLLFTRLILSDDWEFLADKNKSDEFLTSMIKSTVTYKAVQLIIQIGKKDSFELHINKLLGKKIERVDKEQLELQDEKLKDLDSRFRLDDWIQSIISLAQDDNNV